MVGGGGTVASSILSPGGRRRRELVVLRAGGQWAPRLHWWLWLLLLLLLLLLLRGWHSLDHWLRLGSALVDHRAGVTGVTVLHCLGACKKIAVEFAVIF